MFRSRLSALLTAIIAVVLTCNSPASTSKVTCYFDPNSSVPNPFGMRAYLSISGDDKSAVATYEQFPSIESADPKVQVTIESRRVLRFRTIGVAAARRYLAAHAGVYHDLIGDDQPVMPYPTFDKHLTCKSAS
jgi:hypothetical protein